MQDDAQILCNIFRRLGPFAFQAFLKIRRRSTGQLISPEVIDAEIDSD